MSLVQLIGKNTITFFTEAGKITYLLLSIIKNIPFLFIDFKLFLKQAFHIGVKSLILVCSISFFTGAVVAYQSGEQMIKMMPLSYLGVATYKMMTMELGPVLTGIIMAGRYGSSVAAELGTMKVTEQIDALSSMAIDPIRYLALPRFMASIIMLPVAVIFANLSGIMGGYLLSNIFFDLGISEFFNNITFFFHIKDITIGLIKTFVFGGIISLVGIYVGFYTNGGAEGVGKATVKAFVVSSVMILISDLLVALVVI